MAYNKKDEDENTVVKVDRTSVFQEGKPPDGAPSSSPLCRDHFG
jgi:coatomer protein complex subunit gamma